MRQSFKFFLLTILQCFQTNSVLKNTTKIKNDIVQQQKNPNENDILKKEHEKEKDQLIKEKSQLIKENNRFKRRREEESEPEPEPSTSRESSNASELKLEALFTPGEPCTQRIVDHINAAKSEILVQAYSFTSEPIIDALIDASKKGVKVIIILDKSQKKIGHSIKIKEAKIDIYIDTLSGIAHNKIIIIDEKRLFTGSFNFSDAAQIKNAEILF